MSDTEKASKCRRGCRHAIITGKADDDREESEKCTGHTHRGSGDSTHNDARSADGQRRLVRG
ncbi:hypothetical protein OEZ66_02670 [Escherichia coli]|nr:hypothetical protein [Escherichia coli]